MVFEEEDKSGPVIDCDGGDRRGKSLSKKLKRRQIIVNTDTYVDVKALSS